jgi:hypothetical protein
MRMVLVAGRMNLSADQHFIQPLHLDNPDLC